ncbi:biotin--acetyl-CoA-carboxylase ligase [Candidatus Francisella endociliophora]|uniref:Biotin--acetyl-CoA-carboxylase ligase n=1 Tax=Candidatus Francisella endociliophora TaxID=653937 RepID=A0A097ENM5_9GAMM|nr:biotin--[acetyl-CoA-carboxylase] ligase [Francisella sp. FSC1006]AIT09167.1 biotin--acetyl-CoA-carboxylase ligase [Francisella sp. FSC1006]
MKNHNYIEQELSSEIDDIKVEYFLTIGSTNDYLLEQKLSYKYHICYADIQTKGRGRRGGKWVSENQDNIYSSLAFHCNCNISESKLMSVKVALGVFVTIKEHLPEKLQQYLKIKLPNDIYFKDQKLAGILIETKNIKQDSFDIVIGVGINVNMLDISENIDREWISLAIINKQQMDSSTIIVSLVKNIIKYFAISGDVAITEFSDYDYTYNKMIKFNYGDKPCVGIAKGVSKDLKLSLIEGDNQFELDLAIINKIRVIK